MSSDSFEHESTVEVISAVLVAALMLRALLVMWAPAQPVGDGLYNHLYAQHIAHGDGYVEEDGSPAILWPPGWPVMMATMYRLAGEQPRAVLLLNAALDALTAVLVFAIGLRLCSRSAAVTAALLYTVAPGNMYYVATFYSETAFTFATMLAFFLLLRGAEGAGLARTGWFMFAGTAFGLANLITAGGWILLPLLLWLAWLKQSSRVEFACHAVLITLLALLTLAPWVYRNYRVLGVYLPPSGSIGLDLYAGNSPGAPGDANVPGMMSYLTPYRGSAMSDAILAGNRAAYSTVWAFVRTHPLDELKLIGRKLWITYNGDSQGAALISGTDLLAPILSERENDIMNLVANGFWIVLLLLAIVGLSTVRRWNRAARVFILGSIAVWTGLQIVLFGSQRFHVPEYPAYVLLAALGIERLRNAGPNHVSTERSLPVSR